MKVGNHFWKIISLILRAMLLLLFFLFFFFLLSFLVLFFVVELFRKEEFEISANC